MVRVFIRLLVREADGVTSGTSFSCLGTSLIMSSLIAEPVVFTSQYSLPARSLVLLLSFVLIPWLSSEGQELHLTYFLSPSQTEQGTVPGVRY